MRAGRNGAQSDHHVREKLDRDVGPSPSAHAAMPRLAERDAAPVQGVLLREDDADEVAVASQSEAQLLGSGASWVLIVSVFTM